MTKARKRVFEEIKTGKGLKTIDERWYWKLRNYSELTFYWINAFSPVVALLIGVITQDYWKGLGFLFVCMIYNLGQNIRGLVIHLEHLIEWTINKSV